MVFTRWSWCLFYLTNTENLLHLNWNPIRNIPLYVIEINNDIMVSNISLVEYIKHFVTISEKSFHSISKV